MAFFSTAINDGVSEVQESDILVYPNPTTNICYVQLKKASTIEVYDVNGTCVQTLQNDAIQAEIKDLKPGVYILSIQTQHQVLKKKMRFQ